MIADIAQVQEQPKKSKFEKIADALGIATNLSGMGVNIAKIGKMKGFGLTEEDK